MAGLLGEQQGAGLLASIPSAPTGPGAFSINPILSKTNQVQAPAPKPLLPGLGGGPVPSQSTFSINPQLNNQAASEQLINTVIPQASNIAHGVSTGDWSPYQEQAHAMMPNADRMLHGSETEKQSEVDKINTLAFGVIGGHGEGKPSVALGTISPEHSSLLVKASERIKSGTLLDVKDWEAFKSILAKGGYKVPETQAKAAQMILDAHELAQQKAFDTSATKAVQRPATPSSVAVTPPRRTVNILDEPTADLTKKNPYAQNPTQPRKPNGMWDSFKAALSSEKGAIKNPFYGGDTEPPEQIIDQHIRTDTNVLKDLLTNSPDVLKQNGGELALRATLQKNIVLQLKHAGHTDLAQTIDQLNPRDYPTFEIFTKKLRDLGVAGTPQDLLSSTRQFVSSLKDNMGEKGAIKNPFYEGEPKKESQPRTTTETPGAETGTQPPGTSPSSRSSLDGLSPEGQSAVKTITQALKDAKPVRREQEKLYSAARAQKVARASAAGARTGGEKGYFAQLGALKGELPKSQFESVRGQISQPHIDELFNAVEKHPVFTTFEKVTAKTGLAKLLGGEGGRVPTYNELKLLGEVFPKDFIQAVMDKQPLMQRLARWGAEAINLPRAIMATADLSAPLRQGIFLIGKPKQWIPAFGGMFKYAASGRAYEGLNTAIQSRPTYKLMREAGLGLTDMGKFLDKREEMFMSNLSEKIPVFGVLAKGSNRAYSGFLNKLRADTFDDLLKKAKLAGIYKENPEVIHDIAKFVNAATGRGNLGALNRASVVLNGLFFSPKLMASRLNLLNPVFYYKLDPFVRKEALKSLFTFAGTALSIAGLAKLGGASVSSDPRNSDFGKIKVGNTRYDPWGGFQQYIVAASRLITGQMVSSTTGKEFNLGEGYRPTTRLDIVQRLFESKAAPVASFVLSLLKGTDFTGQKFDVPSAVVDRFIPMLWNDMNDLVQSKGLKDVPMAVPGVFGAGVQTYADQIPFTATNDAGNPVTKWRSSPSIGESIVSKVTGKPITDVPQSQWKPLQDKRNMDLQAVDANAAAKQSFQPTYDKIKALVAAGKIDEATAITKALSPHDYAEYKKLKGADQAQRTKDEEQKLFPTYQTIQTLIQQGKTDEAAQITGKMSKEDYRIYKLLKAKYQNL